MPSEFSARPNEPVVEITRSFGAPPAAVFDAWTTPEYVCGWWAPRGRSLLECDVDLRVGGSYRYVLEAPGGPPYTVAGRFVEIDPPHRLVTNFTVDVAPTDEIVEVTSFDALPGGTLVRIVSLHRSCMARDAQLADGAMEEAMEDHFARLDTLLGSP